MGFFDGGDSYDGGYGSSDYENYYQPAQNYQDDQAAWNLPQPYYDQQNYQYDVAPEQQVPLDPAMYDQPATPSWMERTGKGLSEYGSKLGQAALDNPGKTLMGAAGAGMGLWSMLKDDAKVKQPDMTNANAAQAALLKQIQEAQASGRPLDAAAQAKLTGMLNGNYGDFQDEANVRQLGNQKLTDTLNRGMGANTPEEDAMLAQIDQDFAQRGLLGSSLHQSARSKMQDQLLSSRQNRYQQEIGSYRDLTASKNNTQSQAFQNTNTAVGTGQNNRNSAIQGLSSLYNSGINAANTEANVNSKNADLENARTNQLLNTGGQFLGRAVAPDYSEAFGVKKPKGGLNV